jgi:hypothetical protein
MERDSIKVSAKDNITFCEQKYHKPWFYGEYLKLFDRRKQAKLRWLQDPSDEWR